MSLMLFANNASSLLASGITNVASTVPLTPGTGALFPSPGAGQIVVCTIEDTLGNLEIVWVTGRSGDTLTVTRGQEGTTALAFPSGSRLECRPTAGVTAALLQKNGGDTLTGTTNLSGALALGSGGSIIGGEFTGFVRQAAGNTAGQIFVNGSSQPMSGTAAILTNANLLANIPAGYSLAVTNMIVMWYGSSGSIPAGWHVCDGTGGTPDLRDRFVIGAGGTVSPTFGGTGGSASVNLAGGSASLSGTVDAHVLTVAEMPAHNHDYWGPTSASSVASGSGHGWDWGVAASDMTNTPAGSNDNGAHTLIQNKGGGSGHIHGLSGAATFTGTVPFAPPYMGLFFIMKL